MERFDLSGVDSEKIRLEIVLKMAIKCRDGIGELFVGKLHRRKYRRKYEACLKKYDADIEIVEKALADYVKRSNDK